MSFSTVKSAAMEGLAVEMVYVEADVSNGLPIFHMVGYLSSEVKEAAERVRSAVRNSGLEFPAKRVVINLSPATMRKRGASFDLPIAVSILTSLGVLQQNRRMKDCMIIGELGLDGQVRKVPGILSMVSEAKAQKVTSCIVPRENKKEAELVEGVRIIAVGSLRECISYLEDGDRTGGEQRYLGEKEAEHAAKFAELLGEVVTTSTKKNLEMRVDAENGATAGKFELAKLAKKYNLDAIHDTVHEMARDEARHGKAFEGLLKRYFGK